MSANGKFAQIICGLVFLQGLMLNIKAAEDRDAQILFLHLQMTNGAVRLLESTAARGHLKAAVTAENPGDLSLELVSTNNLPVWVGSVPDPLTRRYEYEDPARRGQLKVREVKLDQAEFTVRIPGRPDARRLNIYRLDPPTARPAVVNSSRTKILLGNIELRVTESVQ